EHPNTDPRTLAELVPLNLNSAPSQYLALALAQNSRTPDYALRRLADEVETCLDNQRGHGTCFEIGVCLCCHPATPLEVIVPLLAPQNSATEFRKVVARESRRADVLQLLQTDRSETVRKQAQKTIENMNSKQTPC